MDFSLTEMQSMLVDSVAKFVDSEYDFATRQQSAADERSYSDAVWQQFCELGWTALPFAEADGGLGGGPVETMLLMQQFGRGLVVEPYLANVILAGGVLRRLASEEQKQRWLQPMLRGELQTALAFAEPQSRYEPAAIATTAVPDGKGWVINGRKAVVLNGGNADMLIIPALDNGISLFVVAGDAAGLSRQIYATVDGASAADVSLQDVRVDAQALLGSAGQGYTVLEAAIDDAILAVCAEAEGIMRALTRKTIEYSKNRVQFGVPIGSFQALQHRMVDMFTATEQCYSLLLWATLANAEGTADARGALSALKYQVGTAGRLVGQEAVQIHGGMGMSWEVDVGHYFKRLTVIGRCSVMPTGISTN